MGRLSNGKTWAGGSCDGPTTYRPANGAAGSSTTARSPRPITDPTTGEERKRSIRCSRRTACSSVDQVEGDHLDHLAGERRWPGEHGLRRLRACGTGDHSDGSRHSSTNGDRAFYHRGGDYIQVPPKGKFPKENEFYSTCLHELAHWSEKRTEWTGDYAEGE